MRFINFFFFAILILFLYQSCYKVEENTPYENAQGLWYYSSVCDENSFNLDLLSEILPFSFIIEGASDEKLSLLFLDSLAINASIDKDGNISIPEQKLFDLPAELVNELIGTPLSLPLNVSGSGVINSQDSGDMIITYLILIPFVGSNEILSCDLDLFRDELEIDIKDNKL